MQTQTTMRPAAETVNEPTVPGGVIQYSDYELDYSSPYAGGCAWIGGEYVGTDDAKISLFDFGYTRSDLTYTVVSVWHGNIFRLDDHIQRLLDGAASLRLTSPLSAQELRETAKRCVSLSQLRESFVSIQLTRGFGRKPGDKTLSAMEPQVYIYAIPYRWVFAPDVQIHGASVIVPEQIRRSSSVAIDPGVKNYQWGDLTRALLDAQEQGAHSAILLGPDGLVAEGPGFNVVLVLDGALVTPAQHALPGVTRKTVLEIGESMGLRTEVRDVTADELYAADELIATTTAGGVTPIVELDGKALLDGMPGPITRQIQQRFWALFDQPSALIEAIDY